MCCLAVLLAFGGYLYVKTYGWTLPSFGKKDDTPD